MKHLFFILQFIIYGLFSPAFAQNNNCNATATITGRDCVGSALTVSGNSAIASVTWEQDGKPVLTQTAGLQPNPVVAAGGNGQGTAADQLAYPNRLYVDKLGNMYIPDMTNARIQKWAPGATSGVTVAGGNGIGNAANQFDRPTCVTMDAQGNLYIADQSNYRIQKWAPGATSGVTVVSYVDDPTGIFMDKNGYLYVSEQYGSVVSKFSPDFKTQTIVAGYRGWDGSGAINLSSPTGVYVNDAGELFICDTDNSRIQKWAPGATSGVTVGGYISNPLGICGDAAGNLYVSSYGSTAIFKIAPGASSTTTIINNIGAAGVWVDGNSNLYASDYSGGRVLKFPNIFTGFYTIPAAGVYTAKITTANGCTATSNAIVVQPPLQAKVTITASNAQSCAAAPATYTATPENEGITPLYQWQVNGIDVGGKGTVKTFTPHNLKPGDKVACTMFSSADCIARIDVISNTITVAVPASTPAVTITSSGTIACAAYPVTFTALATDAGNAPTYTWLVNGQPAPGYANSNKFTSGNLNKDDKVTCTILSNATYCQSSATATSNVIVITAPVSTPSVSITANTTIACAAYPITFTAAATDAGNAPVYTWFLNGQPAANATNSATYRSALLNKNDVVTCSIVSNATRCQTTSTATSNAITVNAPTEVPSITIVTNKTTVCDGEAVTFTATALNSGNAPGYTWLLNGTPISAAGNNNTFTTDKLKNGDKISCRVLSNAQYCQLGNDALSAPISMIVKPLLLPAIKIKADLTRIYEGSSITFSADVINGGTAPAYEWMINGRVVSSGPKFVSNKLINGDKVSCKLTNTTDCTSQNGVISNIINITITYIATLTPPNTFTPNGDGVNDTWNIAGITAFPKSVVTIFNRYGKQLYYSAGYTNAWDGDHNGQSCAAGVYYYKIDLGDGRPLVSGSLTLIR